MNFCVRRLSAAVARDSLCRLSPPIIPRRSKASWIAKDFKFHTGETMPELRLHYTTIGEPTGQPVLVLHGSGGSARQHADAGLRRRVVRRPASRWMPSKYYIIIPDGLGHGKSSKPSDGMKTAFPKYNYEDMVDAHYRLVNEGLGVKHLRLVIGNSMGGMHTWIWGVKYPQMHGRAGADGVAADRDGGTQLDAAADDARDHPQRSRLQWRQLHRRSRA